MGRIDNYIDKITTEKNKHNELYEQYLIEGGSRQKEIDVQRRIKITTLISCLLIIPCSIALFTTSIYKIETPSIIQTIIFIGLAMGYGTGIDAMKTYKNKTKKQVTLYLLILLSPIAIAAILAILHIIITN